MSIDYVHGYDAYEATRLTDQASTLDELLHDGTHFDVGSRVLEAGCGIGAQTRALLRNSPDARFTCVDISAASLAVAKERFAATGADFLRADLAALPFADGSFDHVFICFGL